MYECPQQGECGFGWDKPTSCKHGPWIRTSAAMPSGGPTRIKISREVAAQLLGLRSHPAPPENLWVRNIAPREAVKQRYRDDAEKVAAAKKTRLVSPLGPSLVDNDGVLTSAAEYWRNH